MLTQGQYDYLKGQSKLYEEEFKRKYPEWDGGIVPDDMVTSQYALSNAEISAIEHYEVQILRPDHVFAYVDEKDRVVTTWTGERLGRIRWRGLPFRSNLGDTREQINVLMDNGAIYYGTYYKSRGTYCRLKRSKR